MADIQPIRIYDLPTLAGSIDDYVFWIDKAGITNAVKVSRETLETLLRHNNLGSINGGSANDYQHLTTDELNLLQSVDPNGKPDNSTLVVKNNALTFEHRDWYTLTAFVAMPSGANSINTTVDLRGVIKKFHALKIVQGATTVYAIVKSRTSAIIYISGESTFNPAVAIDAIYYYKDVLQPFDVFLFKPDVVFASATVSDVLPLQENPLNVYGKILMVKASCKTEDTGANSTVNIYNSGNVFSSNLEFAGSNYGTVNDSGLTINALTNELDGNLRIDTVNAGNKNTVGAKLEIFYLPQNAY